MSTCVVFVCDTAYFPKFVNTCNQLVNAGDYHGDICLIIGDDLVGSELLNCDVIRNNRVDVRHFPNFTFPADVLATMGAIPRDPMWMRKLFQFHKYHVFDTYFRKWSRILYLDCGITILGPIAPILEAFVPGKIAAHSDAYPTYEWKLSDQFGKVEPHYTLLSELYDLSCDYFQTTIMYFDTALITDGLSRYLYYLTCMFPISITNDQGIIALHFTNRGLFRQIRLRNTDTFFYDYLRRNPGYRYIMLKAL